MIMIKILCWLTLLLAFSCPAGAEIRLLDRIEQARQALESSTLEETERKQALEWLTRARQWLQQAETARKERQALERKIHQAPKRLGEIERLLKQPERLTRHWTRLNLSRPLEWLETRLSEEEAALAKLQRALEEKEQELTQLLEIAATGGKTIAELEQQLTAVENELETLPQPPADPIRRARYLSLQARRLWLQAALERLRLIQSNLALLTKLARGEQALLSLEAAERRTRIERLRQAVQLAREHEVISASSAARLALKTAEGPLRPLWQRNLERWRELEKLVAEASRLKQRSQRLKQRLESLQNDFERVRQAIELAGTDPVVARLLHERLHALPGVTHFRRQERIRRLRIKQIVVQRFNVEEELRQLEDVDRWIQDQLQHLPPDLPPARRALIHLQLREVWQNRREALQALQQEYTRHLGILSEVEAVERQLYRLVRNYRRFLERQLIWIPYPDESGIVQAALNDLAGMLSPGTWHGFGKRLLSLLRTEPGLLLTLVLIVLLLGRARSWIVRDIQRLGQATRSIRTDRFRNTLKALGDTLLLAAPTPLLLFGLGVWLQRVAVADEAMISLADGLLLAARPAAGFGLLRQICHPDGLAQRHLRWLQVTRENLWTQLHWFHPWAIFCAFVVGVTDSPNLTPASLTLGRLIFVVFLLSAAMVIWKLWRRHGPIMRRLAASRPGWIVTYHPLWFPFAVLVPVGLALAALAGYYYAAFHLTEKAFRTLWFFVFLMLLKDLLLRWLYVTERRLRYQEILRKRSELQAQKGEQSSELPPVEEPEVDFGRLSDQTRRLLRIGFFSAAVVGLWLIWRDAIPALNFLQRITLPMTTTRMVGGIAKVVPLTLADVLTGVLLGVLTMLAAKNLPGLLEFAILRRLPLDQGARYAWSALSQYLITAVGIYVIFTSLGVQWSEIQWLIAALSVGLGFGLQEVVANFVSGLILLFERPIRVGDVVTVGDVTGTVYRIHIRATTILNWDRQELVIPNKNFITGQFINWTLTDTTNRIVIKIGVAYGCDVEQAMGIVLESARSHPEILEDPAPLVTFEEFGDNALLIILRAYLGTLDNRLSTITDLHRRIYRKLAEAGIEIAFPQRDVHLDGKTPLQVVVRRPESAGH